MQTHTTTPTRGTRRKEQTRRRLLDAAFAAVSEHGADGATIADITQRADVAFGSFYNHFESKEAVIDAVVAESMATFAAAQNAATSDVADPARVMAVKTRLGVVNATGDPLWGWLLVRASMGRRHIRQGLGGEVRNDIERGIASGRFHVGDLDTTLVAVGGAILHVMEACLSGVLGPGADRHLAEGVLRILGITPEEAAAVATEPLEVYVTRFRAANAAGAPATPTTG